MEDTKSLLIMVLQKVFENRPKIIENTFQLIYNYNNGKREKLEYEKTLKTICELMNEELPSQILVYLLTMVDMPTGDGCQLPIMEKMQKTHNCLPESVRPHLLEYLRTKKPTVPKRIGVEASASNPHVIVPQQDEGMKEKESRVVEVLEAKAQPVVHLETSSFVKPAKRSKLNKKLTKNTSSTSEENLCSPKSLLDICAEYVVQHEMWLKQRYRKLQQRTWRLINAEAIEGVELQQCYTLLKDLNKKTKWLRQIESDSISTDMLMEEYQDSDILIKECHAHQELLQDPFTLPPFAQAYLDELHHSFL